MRKLLFILCLLISFINIGGAQTYVPTNHTYNVTSSEVTSEIITLGGEPFQVYKGKYGKYIATKSKKGNLYPRWVGEKVPGEFYSYHNGINNVNAQIRVLKTGTYLYLIRETTGEIVIKYLKKIP